MKKALLHIAVEARSVDQQHISFSDFPEEFLVWEAFQQYGNFCVLPQQLCSRTSYERRLCWEDLANSFCLSIDYDFTFTSIPKLRLNDIQVQE